MTQIVKDVITWLKQWFYDKDEVDDLLDNASGGISSYRNYEIIPSTYTPNIDANISITINVTNMSGNPVANESVSLIVKFDGLPNITISDTTDANGSVTLNNVQMVKFGLVDLRVGATHCQLEVGGWKQYSGGNWGNGYYYVMYNKTMVRFTFAETNSFNSTTSWADFSAEAFTDSWIRPYLPVICIDNTGNRQVRVRDSSTKIAHRSNTGATISGTLYIQMTWQHRGIP